MYFYCVRLLRIINEQENPNFLEFSSSGNRHSILFSFLLLFLSCYILTWYQSKSIPSNLERPRETLSSTAVGVSRTDADINIEKKKKTNFQSAQDASLNRSSNGLSMTVREFFFFGGGGGVVCQMQSKKGGVDPRLQREIWEVVFFLIEETRKFQWGQCSLQQLNTVFFDWDNKWQVI